MKAKKIIAIGLVAAMTLGMSTSVLAQSDYEDYSKYPVFDQYGEDNTFGPYDNVFHANGQGWLESGIGINESAVNVIVPVTPTITLGYADPGLFDFGVDPQRLVKRTEGRKYANRIAFTPAAMKKGVYFIRPKDDPENKIGEEQYLYNTNYFDTSSVKYKATNIGTKDLELYVTATLSKGSNFDYLTAEPELGKTASAVASDLYNALGEIWAANEAVKTAHDTTTPAPIDFFGDLLSDDPGYIWTGENGVFNDAQFELITTAMERKFSGSYEGMNYDEIGARKILNIAFEDEEIGNLDGLYGFLADWAEVVEPSTGRVGMYMTLNTRTTDENGYEPTMAKATPFAKDDSTEHDAIAETHLTIAGNPDNYETDWDEGTQSYRYKMKSQRTEPFQAAQFWFEGAATNNSSVPEDTKIPKLDFTWRFSQDVPEPPAPVVEGLLAINGTPIEDIPNFDGVLTEDYIMDEVITLTFDYNVEEAMVALQAPTPDTTWWAFSDPNSIYTVDGKVMTVKATNYFANLSGTKYWRISFADSDKFVYLSFSK